MIREEREPYQDDLESIAFEKKLQYLRVLLNTKNDWSREINVSIAKTERASFAWFKFLKYKAL